MEENIEPKKKMSDETKAKLTYSGELVVIALIVLVMGILRLTGVRGYNHSFRMIFNIITTAGAIYGIYNFVSYFVSAKKRAKTALIDVITVLPITLFLIGFDIYCYINVFPLSEAQVTPEIKDICKYCMGGVLVYAGITFLFQGIYHYFKPVPLLYKILEEAEKQAQEEQEESSIEDNTKESNEDDKKE